MSIVIRNTLTGEEVDITDRAADWRNIAHAFDAAVMDRATSQGIDWDEAAEDLTANYTRAEIEEAGHNRLVDLVALVDSIDPTAPTPPSYDAWLAAQPTKEAS